MGVAPKANEMPIPASPKIYHITHVTNLEAIAAAGGLLSDAAMIAIGGPKTPIGMPNIKAARLGMPVSCNPGTFVGAYVPFNFCPRSVMLNIIWYANHPNLTYRGGQGPIVHLEADMHAAVSWAEAKGKRWAFSTSNARAAYTQFHADLGRLDQVNWDAVSARDFRQADVKEAKQAEFLIEETLPWHLVERIGVHTQGVAQQASDALRDAAHRPIIELRRDWYY